MRYQILACDYDGTLATEGRVDDATVAALDRLRASGRRLVLVTGRELDDLLAVFHHADRFDMIVAENGALLYYPASRSERLLAEAPPAALVRALRERKVSPLSVGRVIVAAWESHQAVVMEVIQELGLQHQVIFNKGAVMVLPPAVNKASGLRAALDELRLSPYNVVGIGDAENDHAFLSLCGCSVAVANALPVLKERVDFVTEGKSGEGVEELVERLMENDLA